MEYAFNEIKQKLDERNWTVNNYKDSHVNSNKEKYEDIPKQLYSKNDNISFDPQKKSFNQIADLIWESVDEYFRSYGKISKLFNKLYNLKISNESNDLTDMFDDFLTCQEKYTPPDKIRTTIYTDKNYLPFIYNKCVLKNCLKNSNNLRDSEQLRGVLRLPDRLEYIYYLFGAFEYSNAVNESDYLMCCLNIFISQIKLANLIPSTDTLSYIS